jgi:hypothetical protein
MNRLGTIEMNAQGPISQANPVVAALDEANAIPVSAPFLIGNANDVTDSPIGEGEESDIARPRCSHPGCADTMHELANSVTALLINTQVLEWKLPPYSRLKRQVREIERHAQRSGTLLKGLLGRLEKNEAEQEFCGRAPFLHGTTTAATARGPGATDQKAVKLPSQEPSPSAPCPSFPPEKELTSMCDRCTSTFFPKEER